MAIKASDCHEGERWPRGRDCRAVREHEMHVMHMYAAQLQCLCRMLMCEWLLRDVRVRGSRVKIGASAGVLCSTWLAYFPLRKIMCRQLLKNTWKKTLSSMMRKLLPSRSFALL